jgi:endogenous inhibitor of DNA gyrase (YacG/DUF329 family)
VPRRIACPICGRPAAPRRENAAFPFCSERCKLVDLGRWLGEEYRIAGPRAGDDERPARPASDEEEP